MEKAMLLFEVLLLRNKVPHDVAERRDVVLGLTRLGSSAETQACKLTAQLGQRHFIGKTDGISARVKRDGRLTRPNESGFVLFAHRFGVGGRRRAL